MDTLKSHFSTSCPASSADVIVLMGREDIKENPQCTTRVHCGHNLAAAEDSPRTIEDTEKVPFFYDQNGKCLRFVTSLSANRLK